MVSGKFKVGGSIVTVRYIESDLTATDGDESWELTRNQLVNEYTPISKGAERILQLAQDDPHL